MPLCWKNRESSAATNALMTFLGSFEIAISRLSSMKNSSMS